MGEICASRRCVLVSSFPQVEHFRAGEQLRSPVSRAACVVNGVCAFINKNSPTQGAPRTKPPPSLSAHHAVWSHKVPDSVCR